jgi:hypothetical protein
MRFFMDNEQNQHKEVLPKSKINTSILNFGLAAIIFCTIFTLFSNREFAATLFVHGSDLVCQFLGSKLAWSYHLSPYEAYNQIRIAQYDKDLLGLSMTNYGPYIYNPVATLFLYPFSFLSFTQAKLLAGVVSICSALCIFYTLYQCIKPYFSSRVTALLLSLVGAFFPEAILSTGNGQLFNHVLGVVFVLILWYTQFKKNIPVWFWAIAVLVISIKTQYLAVLLPFVFYPKYWRNAILGSAFAFLLLILYYVKAPYIFQDYGTVLQGKNTGGPIVFTPQMQSNMLGASNWAISGLVRRFIFLMDYTLGKWYTIEFLFPLYAKIGLAFLGGLVLFHFQTRMALAKSLSLSMALFALWAFCFGPVSWGHYLIFIGPLLLVACVQNQAFRLSKVALWCLLSIHIISLISSNIDTSFPSGNKILPLAAWWLASGFAGFAMLLLFGTFLFLFFSLVRTKLKTSTDSSH